MLVKALLLLALICTAAAQSSSSTGSGLPSSCGSSKETECPLGYTCINKACVATPCASTCPSAQQCSYGTCVPVSPAAACTPECLYPEICSLTQMGGDYGMCLSNELECACSAGQVCVYGTCETCTACNNNTMTGVAASTAWGNYIQVSISAAASSGVIADGQWATFTSASSVTLGVVNGAIDQSGLLINTGTAASVTGAITPVGNTTAVVIQAGASLTAGSYVVGKDLTSSIVFQSLTNQAVTPSNAWATLSSLTVNGDLVFAGQGTVNLPSKSSSVSYTTAGLLTVAGNVSLTGNLNALPMYVGYVNSQSGDVRVVNLTTSGTILGSSTDTIFVTKYLSFGGPVIQPILDVSNGAVAQLTASSIDVGDVSLNNGGQLYITNPGASISFSQFIACDSKSLIVVPVSSISSLREGTYTAARFESASAAIGDVACWVKLVDASGASVLLPHAQTIYIDPEEGGNRRLLSMVNSEAELKAAYRHHATWTPSGYVVVTNGNSTFDYNNKVITYSYSKTISYTYVSGARQVMPAVATLIAMIVAVLGSRLL